MCKWFCMEIWSLLCCFWGDCNTRGRLLRSVPWFVILAVVSTMIGFQGHGLVKYGHNYLHFKAQTFSSVSSVCFKKHLTECRVNFMNGVRAVRPYECSVLRKVAKEKFWVVMASHVNLCLGVKRATMATVSSRIKQDWCPKFKCTVSGKTVNIFWWRTPCSSD